MPQNPVLPRHPLWRELALFLGDRFRPEWQIDDDTHIFQELQHYPDVATFYRESDALLYQGIAYHLAGWKRVMHAALLHLGRGSMTILDYGCGGGHDGMRFLDYGYEVVFTDLPGRALDFCRWRVAHRGYEAPVLTLGQDPLPPAQLVWCMDVVEHLPPAAQAPFLAMLGTLANVVYVNLIHDTHADGAIHYPVDLAALTASIGQHYARAWQDIHVMPDGNITRFLVYGRGVSYLDDGISVLINVMG